MQQYLKTALTAESQKAINAGLVAVGLTLLAQYNVDPHLTLQQALVSLVAFVVTHAVTWFTSNKA